MCLLLYCICSIFLNIKTFFKLGNIHFSNPLFLEEKKYTKWWLLIEGLTVAKHVALHFLAKLRPQTLVPRLNYKKMFNYYTKTTAFKPKSSKGHASLDVFLSCVEKELFSNEMNDSTQSNFSGEEWKPLRNLADDRSILIMVSIKVPQW